MKKNDRQIIQNFEQHTLPHFSSKLDVTESNDGFKCYEDEILLSDMEQRSQDEKADSLMVAMNKKETQYALDAFYLINFDQIQTNINARMRA